MSYFTGEKLTPSLIFIESGWFFEKYLYFSAAFSRLSPLQYAGVSATIGSTPAVNTLRSTQERVYDG